MNPLVTIIIPTIGTRYLPQAADSAINQIYKNIQVLIVADGPKVDLEQIQRLDKVDVIRLPYNTGADGYNGHRIYGACTYLAKGEYLCFLDEDNWLDPTHVESLVEVVAKGNVWAFSLRKIVDQDGEFVCTDDCESLGKWESCLGDYFVDVGCYFLSRQVAIQLTPIWYRRSRHPDEQPEVDRRISQILRHNKLTCDTNGQYTLNYRAGNTARSVRKEFFLKGNATMSKKHGGQYPWRK
jgi:glycosyltransferase involved in cell wall biosynthesis